MGYRWKHFGLYWTVFNLALVIDPHFYLINDGNIALSINIGFLGALGDLMKGAFDDVFYRAGLEFNYSITSWFYIPVELFVSSGGLAIGTDAEPTGPNLNATLGIGFLL